MPDHLGDQLSPIPALAAAAAATTTIRIGSFVFANDYRNPVMLAKEIASLDVLSEGRVEFGIGAGWSMSDYRQLGIPYDAPKTRVDRMEESLRLIKRLWTEEKVTHSGSHYQVRDVTLTPRPVQRPHPPIMVGGGGPRMLAIAARESQIVALLAQVNARGRPIIRTGSDASIAARLSRLRAAIGPRYDRLELNVIVFDAQLTDARQSVIDSIAARFKAAATAVARTPFVLYGSKSSIIDQLLERRARMGISYVVIPGGAMRAFAPVVAELHGK